MARSSKRKSGSPRRSPLDLPVRPLLWTLVIALSGAAVAFGARRLWRSAARRPEFRVNPLALDLGGCPEWVDAGAMTAELRACLRHVPQGESIFEEDLTSLVADGLADCPWVLEVRRVERALPNALRIGAVFRRPAGIVVLGGRRYMVDCEGHWLRDDLFRAPAGWADALQPVIVDSMLDTAPPLGERWDGPRLAVGGRLCEFFRREGLLNVLRIVTVDVTGVGRAAEPDIVLTTADGARVKWGSSSLYARVPGLRPPAFLTPDDEKLSMLLAKLGDYPGLRGIEYVDLRFHGQVVFAERD
jgi:hypothetical protein